MKAPASEQKRLLQLHDLDTKLLRVSHELRTLEAYREMEENKKILKTRLAQLHEAKSEESDARRALAKAEEDVETLRERTIVQRNRLDSGQGSAKELQNIASEIEHLVVRQSNLDDVALEAMDTFESASDKVTKIEEAISDLEKRNEELESQGGVEAQKLKEEIARLREERTNLASNIDSELVETYETLRSTTGGAGVVALEGVRAKGMELEFNAIELNAIRTAQEDDVIISEEHELILVRL